MSIEPWLDRGIKASHLHIQSPTVSCLYDLAASPQTSRLRLPQAQSSSTNGLATPGYVSAQNTYFTAGNFERLQAVLFSHPGDFTPVCTTELGEVARRAEDFKKRGVKVIGISANNLSDHNKWVVDINDFGSRYGPTDVQFPIVSITTHRPSPGQLTSSRQIADEERKISALYDMLDQQDVTNRDAKGLPFTVRWSNDILISISMTFLAGPNSFRHRS